jgi:hypothetical protein
VAQGVGPEFKPQYCKTQTNKTLKCLLCFSQGFGQDSLLIPEITLIILRYSAHTIFLTCDVPCPISVFLSRKILL